MYLTAPFQTWDQKVHAVLIYKHFDPFAVMKDGAVRVRIDERLPFVQTNVFEG
ncbi:MAG: hypothetical protein WD229_09390 [Pirellulales bacterium]